MTRVFSFICGLLLITAIHGTENDSKEPTKKELVRINTKETGQNDQETVAIKIETIKIDTDSKGNFKDAQVLQVSIQVNVKEGNVHVNGQRAKHGSVTAFHFHAEIDEIDRNQTILRHHSSPIVIRILVIEEKLTSSSNSVSRLIVEAQIKEIDGKIVKEIDVTQVVVRLDSAKHELLAKRTQTLIRISEAKISSHRTEDDIDVHNQGGRLPKTKLHASKKQMEDYEHSKPMKPKNPLHAEKTSFGGNIDKYDKSICRGFYKLPFAARLSIFLLVAVIGLSTVFCCIRAFCCKSPAKDQKFNLDDFDNKCEFDAEMDAPPLDTKVPLEKQQLIIDA